MTNTALVTGASGFIGRHFTRYLRDTLGFRVDAVDITPSDGVIQGDANDLFATSNTVYDLVVHAAYHVGGRATIDGNPSVLALNLALDANMFDWAVRTGQERVLYFSSSAVYPVELQTGKAGSARPFLLKEEHACPELPILPDARYGWAKLTGEKLAAAAREQGLPVTIVRPFSGYGVDQSTDYPFPSLVGRVLRRESPLTVWGSGSQVRDWIHVEDVVRGAMIAVESDMGLVNLGTGLGTSMANLLGIAMKVTGWSAPLERLRDKPDGVMERVADVSRLHDIFRPCISLESGIREFVEHWS
jgi:nucleoside-diphosphate-sugar epimerase